MIDPRGNHLGPFLPRGAFARGTDLREGPSPGQSKAPRGPVRDDSDDRLIAGSKLFSSLGAAFVHERHRLRAGHVTCL
jgi:hypothetical protein